MRAGNVCQGVKELSHLDILCALDWLCIFPQFLDQEVTGLVNTLLDGNRVGSRSHSLLKSDITSKFYLENQCSVGKRGTDKGEMAL